MKLLLFLVVCLDSMGLAVLLFQGEPVRAWTVLLAFHLVCCAGIGLAGRRSLPARYQQPMWSVIGLLACFAVFVPMLGALGVLAMVVLAGRQPAHAGTGRIQELEERRYIRQGQQRSVVVESGDFQSRLTASAVPVNTKLNTLGKLQGFQARHTSVLFRGALQDEAEEIRLLAFGVLDKKEQAISARIQEELDRFRRAGEAQERREHARQLAYAYWELVYADLVHGDVRDHALGQAKHYAELVVEDNQQDAGMWALLGQVYLRLKDTAQASAAFQRASACGIPETRVLPFLAELAFQQRDFSAITRYVRHATILADVPVLRPVVEYWSGHEARQAERPLEGIG